MSKGNTIEWSHGRPRPVVRVDEVTPLQSADAAPNHEAKTGRFAKGNRAWRHRFLKEKAAGLSTLDPTRAPTWLKPYIELGRPYTLALLAALEGRPVLHAAAGDCADAHVMYRATMGLALGTEDTKERASLLAEARAWLREHRAMLATLSALAGGVKVPAPDNTPIARIRAALAKGDADAD